MLMLMLMRHNSRFYAALSKKMVSWSQIGDDDRFEMD